MADILVYKVMPIGLCIFVGLVLIVLPLCVFQPKKIKDKVLVTLLITWVMIGIFSSFSGLLGVVIRCLQL